MSGQFHKLFLGFGFLFGLVAGLMAFTISYGEYVKHYPTKHYPIKLALRSALVTFLFFLVLSFIVSLLYPFDE